MAKDSDSVAIPLVEEQLHLRRREVETGRVRVRTVAEEHTEMVSETLQHSEADVERVALNHEIDAPPPIREEGDTIIVPVIEERLVKRLFLVEEVRITRRVISEKLQQPVQLRTQRAVVERDDGNGDGTTNDDQPSRRR